MLTYVKFNFFYGNQVSHIKINNISSSLLLLKFFFIPYHLFIFKNKNIFFHKTSMFDFLKIFFRNNKNIYIMLLKYNLLGFSFDSFTNKCSQSAINAISILTPESKYSQNIGNSVILRNNKKSLLNFLKFKNFFFFFNVLNAVTPIKLLHTTESNFWL